MIRAVIVYLTFLLVLFLSSGIRACIPEVVLSKGRDPSERRHVAFFHLGILWLLNFTAMVGTGAGAILLAGELSSYVSISYLLINNCINLTMRLYSLFLVVTSEMFVLE